jgi:hypothetical protein
MIVTGSSLDEIRRACTPAARRRSSAGKKGRQAPGEKK